MIKRILKVAVTFVVFGGIVALVWLAQPPLRIYREKPLPNFPLTTLEGEAFASNDWRTGRPIVINFFASWCGPCRAEMPELAELAKHIPVYGVAVQDDPAKVKAMLEKDGNPFAAVGVDSHGVMSGHLEIRGLPTTLVLDGLGQISYVQEGPIQPGEVKSKLGALVEHVF